jgi:hypothetical protein
MKPRKREKVQRRMKKSHAKPQGRKEGKRRREGDKESLYLLSFLFPFSLCAPAALRETTSQIAGLKLKPR